MAKLIYVTNVTLDGYIEDERGAFDLFTPDDDVFASSVGASRRCRPTRAPTSSSSMSADSETASYSSATALWDSDRLPLPS